MPEARRGQPDVSWKLETTSKNFKKKKKTLRTVTDCSLQKKLCLWLPPKVPCPLRRPSLAGLWLHRVPRGQGILRPGRLREQGSARALGWAVWWLERGWVKSKPKRLLWSPQEFAAGLQTGQWQGSPSEKGDQSLWDPVGSAWDRRWKGFPRS